MALAEKVGIMDSLFGSGASMAKEGAGSKVGCERHEKSLGVDPPEPS
jgi:hypothetical protein